MELKANLIKVQVNIVLVLGKVKGVVVLDREGHHGRVVVDALGTGRKRYQSCDKLCQKQGRTSSKILRGEGRSHVSGFGQVPFFGLFTC